MSEEETPFYQSFELWKKKIDEIVYEDIHLHLNDLPDEDYAVAYEKRTSPEEFAKYILDDCHDMINFLLALM